MPKVGGFNEFVCKLEGKTAPPSEEINTERFSGVNITDVINFLRCLYSSYEHGFVDPHELDRGIEWSTVSPEFEGHVDALFEEEPNTHSMDYIVNVLLDMYSFMRSGGLIGEVSFEDYRRYRDA